ncbi:uncharacterized protein LOC111306816 [Durio zibethinus]|uniref:Uncharacterized protein LOC111306816 n=1 Tax=Durio zibethinus TaxID=66656 RepID=A0A6P6A6X9_DURZI|nr:uncharacterized protein LOC111306816 [Durio zibethinus]
MRVLSNARNLARVLGTRTIHFNSNHRFLSSLTQINSSPLSSLQCQLHTDASSGIYGSSYFPMPRHPIYSMMSRTSFSTEAGTPNSNPTEDVKELYDNMLQSVNVKRTMPPNASLWSMIENCKNREDIKLLFDVLHNLRRFRLSNLRIHSNFNCNLCQEVTRACARVGAIDFGKKALWQHNVYGLTPSIASAHHLLSYAKACNDVKLMVEVMKLLKKNNLPLQAGTADIVFSICYNTNNWELISKYSKRFIKAGVKLRQTTFDTWMEFAVRRGDTESLWNIEKLRSDTMKQHTLTTGFACAKGLLLEHKPEEAAALIQVLHQTLSDAKKPGIADEVEKLVNEWPMEVIKHQKEEDRKALAASLKSDIPAMVTSLLNIGLARNVNLEDLAKREILS